MIDKVVKSGKQVSSESENVSAAAEEQSASLTQVSRTTQTLAEQADELQDMISEFNIGEDVAHHSTTGRNTVDTPPQVSADGGSTITDSTDNSASNGE